MTCLNTQAAGADDRRVPEWLVIVGIFVILLLGLIALFLVAVLQPSPLLIAISGVTIAIVLGAVSVHQINSGDVYDDYAVTRGVLAALIVVMDAIITTVSLFGMTIPT